MKIKVLENGVIKEIDVTPDKPAQAVDAMKSQQEAFDAAIKKATGEAPKSPE